MGKFLIMAEMQTILFIYIFVGFLLRRIKLISSEARNGFSEVLLTLFMPCMVFDSFRQDITLRELLSTSLTLGIAVAVSIFSYILGKFIFNRYPASKRKILRYGALISNSVFAGMPIMKSVYGNLGVFYSSIFVISNRIFMWTAGISMFTDADMKTRVKNVLLNPGVVAVFLGIIRMLLRIRLPSFVDVSIEHLGACTTPISMMIVGTFLADVNIKSVFSLDCMFSSFVRLILIPGVTLLALKLAGAEEIQVATAVILTAMPIGSSTVMLAQRYDADAEFASQCVFLSTVLSMFTTPVLALFL